MSRTIGNLSLTIIPLEEAHCDRCDSVIPQTHILRRVQKANTIKPLTQKLSAYCPHCGTAYCVDRQLRGGVWQIVSTVRVIDDPIQKRKVISCIEASEGNVVRRNLSAFRGASAC